MSSKTILTQLEAFTQTITASSIWVGLSGGLDSTALLHALVSLRRAGLLPHALKAIHVDHGLSPRHRDWVRHCQQLADTLEVELDIRSVAVEQQGKGIEAAAREARYRAFASVVGRGDALFLGHHLDDQAETLLFRLMRGTGLSGLVGMQAISQHADLQLCRPWLLLGRDDIETYAQHHQLSWVDDESNADDRFDRNFLRHRVFPLLKQRWPDINRGFDMTRQWLGEADQLLAEYGEQDLATLDCCLERLGQSVSLEAFLELSPARRKHVIRIWCDRLGYSAPNAAHLEQLDSVLFANEQAHPQLAWGRCELRRFNQRLFLIPRLPVDLPRRVQWHDNTVQLDLGVLSGFSREVFERLDIRYREGGERARPCGRNHSQTVKKLLQEYQLEPWLRDKVPLIYYDNELLAVADLFVCEVAHKNPPDLSGIRWNLGLLIENQGSF